MIPAYGYEYEPAAHLSLTDEDVADFLQSQFSNDLQPFESGRCTYGLWLDVKGKVIADSFVLCEGEAQFRILSEHSLAATISDKLERHIIADDVVIERLPEGRALALIGPEAATVLQSLEIKVPGEGTFTNTDGIWIYPGRRSLEPCFELWSDSAEKISDLRVRLVQAGVGFVSMQQIELMRMAAGIPSIPKEIGSSDLPGEGALVNHGVSLTKGCYLGQEVVARMYNLGRAQRALFLMSGSGEAPDCPVAMYNSDSKQVGELRSAFSTEDGWQGVAVLKTRYAKVGDLLSCESGSAKILRLFAIDRSAVE
ncbi:MAG: folate-binding protein YgfZ [Lentimonas sp.]|jgi:folate-binding protein YgfZ